MVNLSSIFLVSVNKKVLKQAALSVAAEIPGNSLYFVKQQGVKKVENH